MEAMNDALKYVVQAKQMIDKIWDEQSLEELRALLDKAEEALVKAK